MQSTQEIIFIEMKQYRNSAVQILCVNGALILPRVPESSAVLTSGRFLYEVKKIMMFSGEFSALCSWKKEDIQGS